MGTTACRSTGFWHGSFATYCVNNSRVPPSNAWFFINISRGRGPDFRWDTHLSISRGDLDINLPLLWPAIAFLLLPLIRTPFIIDNYRRRKLSRAHDNRLCITCGYDLRATPTRCPECGALVPDLHIEPPTLGERLWFLCTRRNVIDLFALSACLALTILFSMTIAILLDRYLNGPRPRLMETWPDQLRTGIAVAFFVISIVTNAVLCLSKLFHAFVSCTPADNHQHEFAGNRRIVNSLEASYAKNETHPIAAQTNWRRTEPALPKMHNPPRSSAAARRKPAVAAHPSKTVITPKLRFSEATSRATDKIAPHQSGGSPALAGANPAPAAPFPITGQKSCQFFRHPSAQNRSKKSS